MVEGVEERTAEAAKQLWQSLTPAQKEAVEAVAVDMWAPFIHTIEQEVPEADIAHDKVPVSKYKAPSKSLDAPIFLVITPGNL